MGLSYGKLNTYQQETREKNKNKMEALKTQNLGKNKPANHKKRMCSNWCRAE
jgi:hypothetical protein